MQGSIDQDDTFKNAAMLSSKTIIRSKNFKDSKAFYAELLGLTIIQEWKEEHMLGCIFRVGEGNSNALIEIQEIYQSNELYQEPFDEDFTNDKFDIQIETKNVDFWAERLKDQCPMKGPLRRNWGARYLYLRDPDNIQVIIYQKN